MFGFLTPQAKPKDPLDPLHSRKSASEWFQHLPALDVIGRQAHVIHAFEAMRHASRAMDVDRIAAIEYLDAALDVDHRRLIKWYFENLQGSPKLADRFWQAASEVCQSFMVAYHTALEEALAHPNDRKWKASVPLVVARLIYFHGIDAKLRLFRNERWAPAKWTQLHQLFLRATELGIERLPLALEDADPLAPRMCIEQEYVYVLLILLLNTGNLTPAELDWVCAQLRAWGRDLALDAVLPPTPGGFFVDLAGSAGLRRRSGKDQGAQVGYLDTAPLAEKLEHAIAAMRDPEEGVEAAANPLFQSRIAILEKVRPTVSPSRDAELRRHPRVAVDITANVTVGLSHITHDLAPNVPHAATEEVAANQLPPGGTGQHPATTAASKASAVPRTRQFGATARGSMLRHNEGHAAQELNHARIEANAKAIAKAMESAEEIELHPVTPDAQFRDPPAGTGQTPPAPAPVPDSALWRVKDRSVAGWRISAPGGVGQSLALGALVAMRPAESGDWMLGVVRRLHKESTSQLEAGMSLIAERVVAVTLHGRRHATEDMGIVVDGIDASTIGARFEGIYLMPPARLDTRLAMRTLVIPASEYFEGRSLILTTARSNYAVTLRSVVDQRADWSWVTIHVSGRGPRTDS